MAMDERLSELARRPNFAVLTTLFPDGQPQSQIVWIDADDEGLIVNTVSGRQKHRNVQHDPRVSVTIWDRHNPYVFAEVRGRVTSVQGGADALGHIEVLSQRFLGRSHHTSGAPQNRIMLRITPERVVWARAGTVGAGESDPHRLDTGGRP